MRILAIGAHVADLPKRIGGTLARYVKEGHEVYMVTLSYGETVESNLLWKEAGMNIDAARSIREKEFLESARILGVTPISLGFRDNFPINPLTEEKHEKVAEVIRRTKPHILFTHWLLEVYDDHRLTAKSACLVARDIAADSAKRIGDSLKSWNAEDIYMFEPSIESFGGSANITRFIEDVYVDVSDVWDKKMEALKPFWRSQTDQSDYYTLIGSYCGSQAKVKYAERFVQYRPRRVFKSLPYQGVSV